ncbi:MAG: SdiA-regulated domain-containing protein [Fibrobacteria bacterium]
MTRMPWFALVSLAIASKHCFAASLALSLAASLSDYEAATHLASVAGLSAKSFSGVAFHPGTRMLYVVDNDNATVYELNPAGILQRSIATSGFTDPEGISYQSGDYFFLSEEGLANIVRIQLPRTGTGPVAKAGGASLNIASNLGNSGIEGVSYCPAKNTVYAVQETGPSRMYRITLDASGNPTASFPDDPFDIQGKSGDAADILALDDGNFIIVNQEQNKLEGYGPQGQALSSLALGMTKPEGIAIDTADGTIYIVGEPLEFKVFKKKGGQTGTQAEARGYSSSLVFHPLSGYVLAFGLPRRASVRMEYATLGGARLQATEATMESGMHRLQLKVPEQAHGAGIFSFAAEGFHRAFLITSP